MALIPYVRPQFFTNAGAVAAGYKLFFYENGTYGSTNTKQNTTNGPGGATNPNPIILDSYGRPDNSGTAIDIYLLNGYTYTVVLASSSDTDPPASPIWQVDDVEDIASFVSEWVNRLTAARASTATFTVTGDYTFRYTVGRRVKLTGGADRYGRVLSSSYSSPSTTVTVGAITDSTLITSSTLHADMDTAYVYVETIEPNYYPALANETAANIYDYSKGYSDPLRYIPISEHASIVAATNTTDLTTYIQNCVDSAKAGQTIEFKYGPYKHGLLTVTKNLVVKGIDVPITLTGSAAGWKINASIDFFEIHGFLVTGDSTLASAQDYVTNQNVAVTGTYTIGKLVCSHLKITGCRNGINSPGCNLVQIDFCDISSSVGESGGEGYGYRSGFDSYNITVSNCKFESITRHSVYIGGSIKAAVLGNHFINHRSTYTTYTASTNRSALAISRSQNVTVSGNTFEGCHDECIAVDDDDTYDQYCQSVNISNNTFQNCPARILRVSAEAAVSAVSTLVGVENVMFTNNLVYLDATWETYDILIGSAKGVKISDNLFKADAAYAAAHYIIRLNNFATRDGDYSDNITISNNTAIGSAAVGSLYLCQMDTNYRQGTGTHNPLVVFKGNDVDDLDGTEIYDAADFTNPNLRTDNEHESAFADNDATPSVALWNRFLLSAYTGATNVTTFDNGYEGKKIEIRFAGAPPNATLTAAMYLAGGINFTPGARDMITLRYVGSAWTEVSRSEN